MAITYPRVLPNLTDVVSIGPRFKTKVGVTEGEYTFATKTLKFKGQRWEIDYVLVPMAVAKANVWIAWLASMNGREQTFLSPMSIKTTSEGSASSSSAPLVNGADQTGNTLAIDGAPTSETNYFKAGDFFQLGSNDSTARIYMVLQDSNTDGSGEVTLDIWPDLYSSPANNATVTVSDPRGVFKLKSNITEYIIDNAGAYRQLRFSAFGVI